MVGSSLLISKLFLGIIGDWLKIVEGVIVFNVDGLIVGLDLFKLFVSILGNSTE